MNRLSVLVAGWMAALILPTLVMAAPDRTHPKPADDPTINKVEIYFIKNGRTRGKRIGLIKDTNPGSFSWRIPIMPQPKNRCRIKIVLKDASGRNFGTDIPPDVTINPLPTR